MKKAKSAIESWRGEESSGISHAFVFAGGNPHMTTTEETLAREQERKRELEKMAKEAAGLTASVSKNAPPSRGMATADSSGFVDLAAFSDADPGWIDRALEASRARIEEDLLDAPVATARGVVLAPRTLAPVSLESLVEKTGGANAKTKRAPSPHRAAILFVAWTIAVGAVSATIAIVGRDMRARRPMVAAAGIADAIVWTDAKSAPAETQAPTGAPPSAPASATAQPQATTQPATQASAQATAQAQANAQPAQAKAQPRAKAQAQGQSKASPNPAPVGAPAPKKSGPAIAQVKAPPAGPVNPSLLEMMKASAKAPPKPKK